MGCDIHWVIERRGRDERWFAVAASDVISALGLGDIEAREIYDTDALQRLPELRDTVGQLAGTRLHPLAGATLRNYELFGVLSGVRRSDPRTGACSSNLPGRIGPGGEPRCRLHDL